MVKCCYTVHIMDDREFEKLIEELREMNKNIERGFEKVSNQIEKLRD